MKKILIRLIIIIAIMVAALCLQPKVYAATTNYEVVTSTQKYSTIYKVQAENGSDITQEVLGYLKETYTKATEENPALIYIPSGTYYVGDDGNFVMHSNTTIVAESDTNIIKVSGIINSIIRTRASENSTNCRIYGGNWNGNGSAKHGIEISSAKNVIIENVKIQNCATNGINVNRNSEVVIKSGNLRQNKNHGVGIYTSSTVTIKKSKMNYNKAYGVYVSDSKLYINEKNQVCHNDWSGITSSGKTAKMYIQDNIISYNGKNPKTTDEGYLGHGIGVQSGSYANIKNNSIKSNKGCGISVFGDSSQASISKNTIGKNVRHGIGARQGITMDLADNNIYSNSYNGVLVTDNSSASFNRDTIKGNKFIGISVVDNSSVALKYTNISSNIDSNISATGTGASVKLKNGNTITKSKQNHGITVTGKNKLQITGNNNVVSKNKQNGISVKSKATFKISGSTLVKSNQKNGIYINGSTAKITNTTCSYNTKYGVGVEGKGSLTITHSTIKANKKYGINVSGNGTVASIQRNNVYNNSITGIMINNKAKAVSIYKNTINKNGQIGVIVRASSKASSIRKNKITNHTKYGMAIYNSKVYKNNGNSFSNPKAKKNVYNA